MDVKAIAQWTCLNQKIFLTQEVFLKLNLPVCLISIAPMILQAAALVYAYRENVILRARA